MRWQICAVLCLSLSLGFTHAGEPTSKIRIAVASNFAAAASELAQRYEKQSGDGLLISLGATAKHYVQIKHGAPFDIFMAADSQHPEKLAEEGLAIASSRMTYAIGQLALWRPSQALASGFDDQAFSSLQIHTNRKFAIANPVLAPYGAAAKQALTNSGLWPHIQSQLVTGENVAQTYQFIASGAAELGLVAWSQVQQHSEAERWKVPSQLHDPIKQQAIQLNNKPQAKRFMQYLASAEAKLVIRQYGYLTP